MSEVLAALQRDHINMAALLNVLDRQFGNISRADVVDWEVVDLILGYLERYADQCHHPTEDLIYEALTERRVVIGEYIRDLRADHADLSRLTQELHNAVADVSRGSVSAGDNLATRANRFLKVYRRHMELEDTLLFPAAREKLSDQDWADVDARALVRAEPAFAKNVQARFLALRDYIHTLERINLAQAAAAD